MSIWKNGKLVAGGRQVTPLLSFMWADHILDDISWLRADTFSWQNGSVYQAVYQHLANDIDGKSLQSEIIGSTTIQFYLAGDGHKICPESEMSNVAAIYAATGVAWYYIIDTVNERFKLPRINPDLEELAYQISAFGDGDYLRFMSSSDSNKGSYINSHTESLGSQTGWLQTYNSGGSLVNLGNMKLSDVKGQSGIKVEKDTIFSGKKYLYFYVGAFTQTALENTAGITAETLNDKVDKGHQVIAFQAPTAANNHTWYRLYADGWVEQGGIYDSGSLAESVETTITMPVVMSNNMYSATATASVDAGSSSYTAGSTVIFTHSTTQLGIAFWRASSGCKTRYLNWQVSGMAA